ncbi:MAG: hypothetical protein ABFS35_18845 [Bacteroidota bacterium]
MNEHYNDICSGGSQDYLNTGAKDQCLEAVTVLLVLAKEEFRFDTIADFKDKTKWDAAIASRDLVPLYELYELTPANTDETFYENRNFRKRTGRAVKITTAEAYTSICSHNAMVSYAQSTEYTRLFEVTEDGDVMGVYDDDLTKIKGQKIKDFTVGIRQPATTEKPPTSPITMTYADYREFEQGAVIATPDFDPVMDLYGIFDVKFNVISASATTVVFTATSGCKSENYGDLDLATLKLFEADGVTDQSAVFTYDSVTMQYTATGTGFVTGVLSTDGVQTDSTTGEMYEGSDIVTIV